MEVLIKNFKIKNTSNLLTSSNKDIELDGDCECVMGKINEINEIEFDFDFEADSDFMILKGQARVTLTDVTIEYRVKPFIYSTSESFRD